MEEILDKLLEAVELGKTDKKSPYPPQFKDQDGAHELTVRAIDMGIGPQQILEKALIPAMERVGKKFSENKIYVPQMLLSAKAMGISMVQLKPFFTSGTIRTKGTFIMGTVKGDLHDIGKNLVCMMVEGGGWKVIDLGVDVSIDKYVQAVAEHPGAMVGLSALLTTTMENMFQTVTVLRAKYPHLKILVGGAPVTQDYCDRVGADFYSPDPSGAVSYLNQHAGV